MDKRMRTILVIAGVAVAAYLVYRWWSNRSDSASGLGTNLNSATPELVAGSSGPDSGLNYYAGSTTVNLPPVDITDENSPPGQVISPKSSPVTTLPGSPVRNPVEKPGKPGPKKPVLPRKPVRKAA